MNYTKTIVCLANSRKSSNRCIAGKEWLNGNCGEWIRPISEHNHGAISKEESQLEDGQQPNILDIITITLKEPSPHGCQTENHLIAEITENSPRWKKMVYWHGRNFLVSWTQYMENYG